jgi:hypothetical protein
MEGAVTSYLFHPSTVQILCIWRLNRTIKISVWNPISNAPAEIRFRVPSKYIYGKSQVHRRNSYSVCQLVNWVVNLGTLLRKCHLKKGKAVPLQAWSGPEGSRKLRFPEFMITAQDGGKVVSLTHRPPLPPGNTPGTHSCWRLSRPQGHSATSRIMSLKNSNDTTGNRTRDLLVCNVVP